MTQSEAAPTFAQLGSSQAASRVLFDLLAGDFHRRWLVRSARGMGWALTAYACLPYLFIGTKSTLIGKLAIWQNLVVLSWLAGLATLVVAAPQPDLGAMGIARWRGVSVAALARVEWAISCSVPFKVLAPAGLLMSVLATAHTASWSEAWRSLLTLFAVLGYLFLTAGVLGLAALWARRLAPQRGRSLFLLVMLLPLVLERALSMKSLPTVLGELLNFCLKFGSLG